MIQLQVAKSLTQSLTHSYMNDITCKLHRKCSSLRVLDFPTQGKKYLLYRCPYLKEVRVRMGSAPRVENSPNHLPEKLRCTIGNILVHKEQKETASFITFGFYFLFLLFSFSVYQKYM